MGAVPDGGLPLPDPRASSTPPRRTPASSPASSSSSRPCSARSSCATSVSGRIAWAGGGGVRRSAFTCSPAPAATSRCAGDGLVLLCASAFAAHILATGRARRGPSDVGALARGPARRVRRRLPRPGRRRPATSRRRTAARSGRRSSSPRVVRQRARLLRPDLRPAARAARAHRADPRLRARLRRPVRLPAGRRPPRARGVARRRRSSWPRSSRSTPFPGCARPARCRRVRVGAWASRRTGASARRCGR